ncbi:hypothetical protein FP2506_08911 [Fulvimarina pelagi HTCC2506]|uniref:DUF1236 domain-containing protein n=1 Tax=Fulvimarina pelagi HTCC2506 TaxID=314231 RepID=Q0G5W4_9HYPH|nr:DUF1236 domain-containing protein [Fulvimarina pelagi]EAU42950.1 hypothetical protein FP2506_08911 [Fulvimarina pelagi HTCC2506]
MSRFGITWAAALAASLGFVTVSAQAKVNVVQFAASNPVANASLQNPPSLGASVPSSVNLQSIDGASNFGYFYYNGQPVIVDMRTRAIVKIGA